MATATSLSSSGLARIQRQLQQFRATRGIDPPSSYVDSLYRAALEAEAETADAAQTRQQALDIQNKSLEQSNNQFNENLALQRQQLKAQGRSDTISGVGTLALGGAMLYPQIKAGGAALGLWGTETAAAGAAGQAAVTGAGAGAGLTSGATGAAITGAGAGAAGTGAALASGQAAATGAGAGVGLTSGATEAAITGTGTGAATGAGEAAGLTWSGAAVPGVAGFAAGSIAAGIGGGKSTTTKAAKGAVGGAAAGAAAGSIVPGVGTAIGAVIGAVAGAIGGGSSK